MTPAISSAYAQLLSLGVVWVALHCSGMCGPLVLGFGFDRAGARPRGASAVVQVLAYQAGKALVYASLGALAAALGRTVARALAHAGPYLAGAFGVALLAATLWKRFGPAPRSVLPPAVMVLVRRVAQQSGGPLRRAFALGLAMSALPCMLVGWVLALAATTRSPLHGAALMLLLVAMNSVPLLGVVRVAALLRARAPALLAIQPWLTAISGVWLLLVAAASAGLVPHASLPFQVGGRGYVVMFW